MPHRTAAGTRLALLSFGSGCMDILSYQDLGAVFTSAMTGNTALLGLEIGEGDLGAASRNIVALAGFLLGVAWGAAMLRGAAGQAGWSGAVTRALVVEAALLAAFTGLWIVGGPAAETARYGLIALSAIAMGIQSAAAFQVGLPGVTTTYFTGTITNVMFGAVGRAGAREPPDPTRRRLRWPATSFLAYVAGAVLTGWLATRQPFLPPAVLTVLPALAVCGVLGAVAVDGWLSRG